MGTQSTRGVAGLRELARRLNEWPCRQCGTTVKALDEMCPRCGTYGPVRWDHGTVLRTAAVTACLMIVVIMAAAL